MRFARQQGIEDTSLCEAIANADRGLIDVDLGGEVIKQRIARPNEGKSVGSGRLSCSASGDKSFFVYGFSKSARGNIRKDELKGF